MPRVFSSRWTLSSFIVGFVLAIAVPRAMALDPEKGITQFCHQSWGASDGLASVSRIAQTKDGYLWIAAANGLFRYDGVQFLHWAPLPGEPQLPSSPGVLESAPDGSLWLGCGDKVCRLAAGHIKIYSPADGLPGHDVQCLLPTEDGTVWAGCRLGLARFANGKWTKLGEESGLPEEAVLAVDLDQKGVIWVCTGSGKRSPPCLIAALRPGKSRFEVFEEKVFPFAKFTAAPDGKIWIPETPRSARAFLPSQSNLQFVHPEIKVGATWILSDRDGSLWVASLGDGLRRARVPSALGEKDVGEFENRVDLYTQKDGLSGDVVASLFEDREGDVWCGTNAGLDCFREAKVAPLSVREGIPFDQDLSVKATSDGHVWIGSPKGFADWLPAEKRFVDHGWFDPHLGPGNLTLSSMFADDSGKLFLGTGYGLVVVENEDARRVESPVSDLRDIRAITMDPAGKLVIGDSAQGLFLLDGNQVTRLGQGRFPSGSSPHVLYTDRDGRLWVGKLDGGVETYASGEFHAYTSADGLFSGVVQAIVSDAKGEIWLAGGGGLSRFRNGRFQTLDRREGLPEDELSSLLIDDDGAFWLGGTIGIFHVQREQLESALASEGTSVQGDFFDSSDGLRGFLGLHSRYSAMATKSTDGKLWFTTNRGLAVIDPKNIPRNAQAPLVHIQEVRADGIAYAPTGKQTFSRGAGDCEIHYVGLSFSNPSKVRYHYQLEGYDRSWIDAGTRREAFYSHLRPGNYRFLVAAGNEDGVWSAPDEELAFSIPRAFYETAWFPSLCALLFALLLWGLYRLRIARLTSRIELQLESQNKERRRIAQELHDTLLQGFTGIGLKLDAIASGLPETLTPVREQLRKILDQSDQYLAEVRRCVWELRSSFLEKSNDFPGALKNCARRVLEATGIQLDFSTEGALRRLPDLVEGHLLRICEEALANAVKHAQPRNIRIRLAYAAQEVRLQISDDGRGFDPTGPEASKAEHFGLSGIRERVNSMGGKLVLQSEPGKGTEISVTAPLADG